jgi:mannose-6-phosphate isomerase-like protein (cupin superfamily)
VTNLQTATAAQPNGISRRAARTALREGDAYWFYGDLVVVRSPEGADPIIIEHHVGPGGAAPLHIHVDLDDSFYVASGELAVRCGDDTFVARAGDYVSLPEGIPHTLRVVSDQEAVLLQTHAAASFLNFIKAVGIPATDPRPDMAMLDFAAMNRVAGETGQPVVGPPMSAEEATAIVATAQDG